MSTIPFIDQNYADSHNNNIITISLLSPFPFHLFYTYYGTHILTHHIYIVTHTHSHTLCTPPTHTHSHRHLEWRHLEAVVNGDNTVDVKDVTNDAKEHLEFQDRIIKASLGWGHLIVTTSTQCYIFK